VRGTGHAIWRRILLVPFTVTIPEDERDLHLLTKLLAELPGVMLWALEGLRTWRVMGLAPPPAVRQATGEYRAEMDTVEGWIRDRCKRDPNAVVTAFPQPLLAGGKWKAG